MKKFSLFATLLGLFVATCPALAVTAPVNIASPVNSSTVTHYFYSSFTTTCPGGQYTVKWYLDSTLIGNGVFYNSAGFHASHKLSSGWHTFQVSSSCGQDTVKFYVQ